MNRIPSLACLAAVALAACATTSESPVTDEASFAAACTGAPMTRQQALARFAPASDTATLGRFHAYAETRRCARSGTGCEPWRRTDTFTFGTRGSYAAPDVGIASFDAPFEGTAVLHLANGPDVPLVLVGDRQTQGRREHWLELHGGFAYEGEDGRELEPLRNTTAEADENLVTDHCLVWTKVSSDASYTFEPLWNEWRVVFSATY